MFLNVVVAVGALRPVVGTRSRWGRLGEGVRAVLDLGPVGVVVATRGIHGQAVVPRGRDVRVADRAVGFDQLRLSPHRCAAAGQLVRSVACRDCRARRSPGGDPLGRRRSRRGRRIGPRPLTGFVGAGRRVCGQPPAAVDRVEVVLEGEAGAGVVEADDADDRFFAVGVGRELGEDLMPGHVGSASLSTPSPPAFWPRLSRTSPS